MLLWCLRTWADLCKLDTLGNVDKTLCSPWQSQAASSRRNLWLFLLLEDDVLLLPCYHIYHGYSCCISLKFNHQSFSKYLLITDFLTSPSPPHFSCQGWGGQWPSTGWQRWCWRTRSESPGWWRWCCFYWRYCCYYSDCCWHSQLGWKPAARRSWSWRS